MSITSLTLTQLVDEIGTPHKTIAKRMRRTASADTAGGESSDWLDVGLGVFLVDENDMNGGPLGDGAEATLCVCSFQVVDVIVYR